jgi:hypothetical protein
MLDEMDVLDKMMDHLDLLLIDYHYSMMRNHDEFFYVMIVIVENIMLRNQMNQEKFDEIQSKILSEKFEYILLNLFLRNFFRVEMVVEIKD